MRHLLPLILCLGCPALAAANELDVLARGVDGKPEPSTVACDDQAELDRVFPGSGLSLGERAAVIVYLGEQPAGMAVEVQRAVPQDELGFHVELRLAARGAADAKQTERPYVVVALPRTLRFTSRTRVTLTLGDAELGPMSVDASRRTHARLAALNGRQRRRATELSLENAALRAQVYALEREIRDYQDDDAYEAAVSALPFKQRIRRVVGEAAFRTDLQLFGTTLNPLWTSGDENLKYIPVKAKRKAQTAELEQGYAEEKARLVAKLTELRGQLDEMQTFAQAHAQGAADVVSKALR